MRISDWSSDVYSSDLVARGHPCAERHRALTLVTHVDADRLSRKNRLGKAILDRCQHLVRKGLGDRDRRHAIGGETVQDRSRIASPRSEEHTSELQSLMPISYAVFCLKTKNPHTQYTSRATTQTT